MVNKKMLVLALLALGLPVCASGNEKPQRRSHCGCSCCCPPPPFAPRQDRQRPPLGPPPSFIHEDLVDVLSLTDEQRRKIEDWETSFRKQMDEMRRKDEQARRQNDEKRKKEMDALMEAQRDSLKSILSDNQYELFQEYMEKNRPKGPRGPEDRFGPGPDRF
ncbi:hypothetical protein [uncultured Parabacteroides sp.]|uniref:hypothetical protein n=1 Tax=uncultured Parabacteroides sp. TaxID=512312 RepID=UPI0026104272|nr:hypothetical protein [uncultured Parabacteroides sp.]